MEFRKVVNGTVIGCPVKSYTMSVECCHVCEHCSGLVKGDDGDVDKCICELPNPNPNMWGGLKIERFSYEGKSYERQVADDDETINDVCEKCALNGHGLLCNPFTCPDGTFWTEVANNVD